MSPLPEWAGNWWDDDPPWWCAGFCQWAADFWRETSPPFKRNARRYGRG